MTPTDIAAARELIRAATPGPWSVWDGPAYMGGGRDLCIGAGETWLMNMNERQCRRKHEHWETCGEADWTDICSVDADDITAEQIATANLIAASRTLLPAALDALEKCRAALGRIAARGCHGFLPDPATGAIRKCADIARELGPDDFEPDEWCPACIASAYIEPGEGEGAA